jgi:hypothetical protein
MQNVNLYQRERRRHGGPTPGQMLLGLAAVTTLLLLQGGWQGWRLYAAGQAARLAEQQAQAVEARLSIERAAYREPKLDSSLPARLADAERGNRQLLRLVEYMQSLDTQRSQGFAASLAALADRHPPGSLWLTQIRLSEGGSNLVLQGFSQSQEWLPLYLQSLGQSQDFRGREFARFDLQREPGGLLRFALSSRADEEKGK